MIGKKGAYYVPPTIKSYNCTETDGINEIGILKIKEGKILIRIAFVTFRDREEIVIFGAFDKPDLYKRRRKERSIRWSISLSGESKDTLRIILKKALALCHLVRRIQHHPGRRAFIETRRPG